jgi:hypothetical protein
MLGRGLNNYEFQITDYDNALIKNEKLRIK